MIPKTPGIAANIVNGGPSGSFEGFLLPLLVAYSLGRTHIVLSEVSDVEGFYDQATNAGFLGATGLEILFGLSVLLVGLLHQSSAFERLVGSRVRGPLHLAYGTYGLPLMLLLMEWQRRTPRRGGGGLRVLIVLALVAIVVIVVVLALIAFLLYRYLSRRRR